MKIFLDDIRLLPWFWSEEEKAKWTVIETGEECIRVMEEVGLENIEEMSLDNDLGEGISGYDVVKWIEEQVIVHGKPLPKYNVHSANPVNAKKMWDVLNALADRMLARTVMERLTEE